MTGVDIILHEEEQRRIARLAERLVHDANARFVALIDRNGQPLAWAGELGDVDRTSLASLAAGNVAATEGLARMIGERCFSSMYHEGDRGHLYLSSLSELGIVVVAFDERSSLGLVRLRVRQITPAMQEVLDEIVNRSRAASAGLGGYESPLAEITDDDIESLFRDGF